MKFDLKSIWSRNRQSKQEKDNLNSLLLPSVISIVLCVFCLVGTTFAWFSSTQTTGTQIIQTANFSADILIDNTETDNTTLAIGTHTVSMTAKGTASTGYFIVEYGNQKLHTVQVQNGETVTFTLVTDEELTVKITPQWGTSAKASEERIHSGDILTFEKFASLT